VVLLKDAIKGIKPEDEEKVIKELEEKGAEIATL